MTADRRADIRARLDAATPGPWSTTPHRFPEPIGDSILVVGENGSDVPAIVESAVDAELIAHAPADLRWLLDDADAARAALAALVADVEALRDQFDARTRLVGDSPQDRRESCAWRVASDDLADLLAKHAPKEDR